MRPKAVSAEGPRALPIALLCGLSILGAAARAQGLDARRLGVIYERNDAASVRVARYYARARHIPAGNIVGVTIARRAVISRGELGALRRTLLARLPFAVQSLLLIWSEPYAVECMSITTAVAAGFSSGFCEPGCGLTTANPLYDAKGWLPADTAGWLPAMLLPSDDVALAKAVIDRGVRADGTRPPGTVYLVRTADPTRNVRAREYPEAVARLAGRVTVREISAPIAGSLTGVLAYFTGAVQVAEIRGIHFRPGAAADHLTSSGGVLVGGTQMSVLAWLRQGATASYGTVSEPCNRLPKFPNPAVFMNHYLRGDTLLEAYWKSVFMPGQGLFVGEPLARPYGRAAHAR